MAEYRARKSRLRIVLVASAGLAALITALAVWKSPRILAWRFVHQFPAKGAMAIEASEYGALWKQLQMDAASADPSPQRVYAREMSYPNVKSTDKVGLVHFSLVDPRLFGGTNTFEEVVGRAGLQPRSLWDLVTMSRDEFATYRRRMYPQYIGEYLYSEQGPHRFAMMLPAGDRTFMVQIWSPEGAWVQTTMFSCREADKDWVEECLRWLAGYLRVIEF